MNHICYYCGSVIDVELDFAQLDKGRPCHVECLKKQMDSLKCCGNCKHFEITHDIDPDEDDDRHYTYCALKEEKEGYWSSSVSRDNKCDDWEAMYGLNQHDT